MGGGVRAARLGEISLYLPLSSDQKGGTPRPFGAVAMVTMVPGVAQGRNRAGRPAALLPSPELTA